MLWCLVFLKSPSFHCRTLFAHREQQFCQSFVASFSSSLASSGHTKTPLGVKVTDGLGNRSLLHSASNLAASAGYSSRK